MLLKKAGMIVLGTAAGVAALSGTAFAGEAQATTGHGHDHSYDRDHGHNHDRGNDRVRDIVNITDDDFSPSADNEQAFFGSQTGLVNLGNTNVQAPISAAIGLLGAVEG